eukprot:879502_1
MKSKILAMIAIYGVSGDSSGCGERYLTDLDPIDIGDNQRFYVNNWKEDGSQQIYTSLKMGDNYYYDEYIVLHPSSDATFNHVIYDLHSEYDTFTAVIGMENNNVCVEANNDGVEYKFYLDNELVYESAQLSQHQFMNVNIDIRNGNKLKIEVYKRQNNWCDHATIANPILSVCHDQYNPCEWNLVYENDINGEVIHGSLDELQAHIQNGKELRIVGDCNGVDCNFVITKPQRIWVYDSGVYIYDQGSGDNLHVDANGMPIFNLTHVYQSVFATNGRYRWWQEGIQLMQLNILQNGL